MARVFGWLFGKVLSLLERLNRHFSVMGATPFFVPDDFDWVPQVEARWPLIRRELLAVQAERAIPAFQEIMPDQVMLTQDQRWKTFFLYGFGHRIDANCELCPETDAALQLIPGVTTAMFSILKPGKELPPHRGYYNGVLRYQLALVVPEPPSACAIRVHNEIQNWHEGESMVFDDTFTHQAWNRSDADRAVLFVDFVRPLRTPMKQLNWLLLQLPKHLPAFTDSVQKLREFDAAHAGGESR